MTVSTLSLCLAASVDDVLNRADMWQSIKDPRSRPFSALWKPTWLHPDSKQEIIYISSYETSCDSRTVGVENNIAGRLKVDVF